MMKDMVLHEVADIHYRRTGQGQPLILLHGFASSSAFWKALPAALGEDFDIIAPDWPGFGMTSAAMPLDTAQDFAAFVLRLADLLGLECFHVLGHSMSGFVVQELLAHHGARLLSATLYGAGLQADSGRRFESLQATLSRLENEGTQAAIKRILGTWFAQPLASAEALRDCENAARGMTLQAAKGALTAFAGVNYSSRLDHATTPTLVILGECERSHPPVSALELAGALPGAHLAILPFCGHAAHMEQPKLFGCILREFLLSASQADN